MLHSRQHPVMPLPDPLILRQVDVNTFLASTKANARRKICSSRGVGGGFFIGGRGPLRASGVRQVRRAWPGGIGHIFWPTPASSIGFCPVALIPIVGAIATFAETALALPPVDWCVAALHCAGQWRPAPVVRFRHDVRLGNQGAFGLLGLHRRGGSLLPWLQRPRFHSGRDDGETVSPIVLTIGHSTRTLEEFIASASSACGISGRRCADGAALPAQSAV